MGKVRVPTTPTGLCNSPDVFKENMSEFFVGLDTGSVYIDDILHVIKGYCTEPINFLEEMCDRLQNAGIEVNAGK